MRALSPRTVRIGEAVDRLISVDLSGRGFISILYEEARKANGGRPLCLSAASILVERTQQSQPVVIATGLPIRGWFSAAMAENDGPIGAATLARALYLGLGALPVVICEAEQLHVVQGCLRAVGLTPATFEEYDAAERSRWAVKGRDLPLAIASGFPSDITRVGDASMAILDRKPSAMISIERQGADDAGKYHYGRGEENIPDVMAKIDLLFEEALSRGIYTVGIGDGGNELGMANIRDAIRAHLPFGEQIAPAVRVSLLVAASVSNFGCYGVAACIAALLEKPNVLHSPEQDLEAIAACARLGAVDGATGFIEPYVDGLPAAASAGTVQLLNAIVRNGLSPTKIYQLDDEE